MRVLHTLVIPLCALLALAGCAADPAARCGEAYDHMITLAKRPPSPAARDPFIDACVLAWDAQRHECLMAATSADQALDCRSQRANN
jgi:hypothetical protein